MKVEGFRRAGMRWRVPSVIAGQGAPAYGTHMVAPLLRLMMLIALALMPFGMANAPAVAASIAPAAAGHCDEHQKPDNLPAKMDMSCASCTALPAPDVAPDVSELRHELPRLVKAVKAMSDTEPEIATPPPKLS